MGQLVHAEHRENDRVAHAAHTVQSAKMLPLTRRGEERLNNEERVENWIADAILTSGYLLISLAILAVIYLVAQLLGYVYPLLVQAG